MELSRSARLPRYERRGNLGHVLYLQHPGVTAPFYASSMSEFTQPALSPSLNAVLRCPRRFHLEKLRRARTLAPFASSALGQEVHRRIAQSLREGAPADEGALTPPRRVLLQAGETLDSLIWRAQCALTLYNVKCRAWLQAHPVKAVEHYCRQPYQSGAEQVTVSGIFDLILASDEGDVLVDWKTGGADRSETQLKFYLVLRFLETGQPPRRAEAISLSTGRSLTVPWTPDLPLWFGEMVASMMRWLEACREDTPEAGGHCRYCPYAYGCEHSEAPGRTLSDTFTGEVFRA